MSSIKLSIIIPFHDSIDLLSKLLKSIPSNPTIEIIIVNDHGPKLPDDLLESSGSLLRYFELPAGKRWAGAARNLGLKYASGEFVLFADSDDFFLPGFMDNIDSYINKEKKYDIVYFTPQSIKSDGSKSLRHIAYKSYVDDYLDNENDIIRYKFHVPWSKLFNLRFLLDNDILFDEVVASNDVNFSLKASLMARCITASNKPIYCVVESLSSLTKQKSECVIDARFDALCRYNEILKSRGDKNLAAMSGHLYQALQFGFYKFLSRYFYCKYKRYPIFYGIKHVFNVLFIRNRG